jgi:hypothetical protein
MKPGYHGDGNGLYLQVGVTGRKSWVFRFKEAGKLREMGLGSLHTIGLAEAREKARDCRRMRLDGADPIEERRRQRAEKLKTKEVPQAEERYLSLTEIKELPRPTESGIYFLFLGGALQYIGQSANVFTRVAAHRKGGAISFDDWVVISAPLGDLDAIEANYIRKFKPPFNRGLRRLPTDTHVGTHILGRSLGARNGT